ncbi:unnamed protein product, partial [Didymodactylos carnosus]
SLIDDIDFIAQPERIEACPSEIMDVYQSTVVSTDVSQGRHDNMRFECIERKLAALHAQGQQILDNT